MVERICPDCQHANPLHDRYCGKCGTALERQILARRAETNLTIAGHQLPVTWRQLGKTVALGVAAVAAEAGLAYLRRRIETVAPLPAPLARPTQTSTQTTALTRTGGTIVTIISQRVVEILDSGDGRWQVSERNFWRKIEE